MFGIYVLFALMKMSSAYHLEAYAQTKKTNHIFEDILRNYVGHKQTLWEQYLFMVDFAYNVS